jgi:hypothetical protein
MTGWRTLLEYQAAVFLPECEGFSLNSVYGSRIEDFLRILCQGGSGFRVFGSSESPEFV